jgi:hypothetical protein
MSSRLERNCGDEEFTENCGDEEFTETLGMKNLLKLWG